MIVGKYICANCGKDCTPPAHLWGFGLMIRGTLNPSQQKEIEALKVQYGQGEFIFCWECAARAMGAKTLAEKERLGEKPKENNNGGNDG